MKKILTSILLGVLLLSGCSPQQTNVVDKKEVIKKIKEKGELVENVEVDSTMSFQMDDKKIPLNIGMKLNIEMKLQEKPTYISHVKMNMSGSNNVNTKLELFVSDKHAYLKDESGKWITNTVQTDNLIKSIEANKEKVNASSKFIEKFESKVSFTESNDEYTYKISDKDLTKEELQDMFKELLDNEQKGLFNSVSVKSMNLQAVYDKKTLYPKTSTISIEIEQDETSAKLGFDATFKNIGTTKIEIPEEVAKAEGK